MKVLLALLTALLLHGNLAAAEGPPARPSATAYPSGASVPENLLRIELRLSRPWHGMLDMRHVRLLDAEGRNIDNPFLDLPLSSADGTRIAVLLHPGRVKSGVGANLRLGRALRAGSSVTLVVDDPQLARPIRKAWQVVDADTRPPEPARWSFDVPASGGRSPLVVQLDGSVSASAEALIAIRAADGSRLPGTASLLNGETTWRFVPAHPWRAGRYAIATHPDLEDPAGNRICRPFETTEVLQADCAHSTARPFTVSATVRARFVHIAGEFR